MPSSTWPRPLQKLDSTLWGWISSSAIHCRSVVLERFDSERTSSFYMRNTPQPLEIAYLDAGGAPVDIIRMEPCADVEGCPTSYAPSAPYVRTIEVPIAAGGAAALGIEPGSRVVDTGFVCSV